MQRTESESMKYLMKIKANIGFVNGVYLEKFEVNIPKDELKPKRSYKGEYEKFLENEKKEKEEKEEKEDKNDE